MACSACTAIPSIRYSVANLMNEGESRALAAADVVFCRNVFIYFSEIAITTTVRSFARFMPVTGVPVCWSFRVPDEIDCGLSRLKMSMVLLFT